MSQPEQPDRSKALRVFALTTGSDTAGINVAIKGAFDRHADASWHVDSMVASRNYIEYPVDVPWNAQRLGELWDAADVIHLHSSLHAHRWYDDGQGKPVILHHHGLHDGSGHTYADVVANAREVGAIQVASTYDLTFLEPDVRWLPAPANLPWLRSLRQQHYVPSRKIRIGHAPTNPAIKGTAEFIEAFQQPALRRIAEPILIQNKPWSKCLRLKAMCDVFYDQAILGYGSNAIEAWGMGLPVIAGVADPDIRAGMFRRWSRLPFYEAHGEGRTLFDSLMAMASSDELRTRFSRFGTTHVARWHDEAAIVATLQGLYKAAGATQPGGNEKRLSQATLDKIARHRARDERRELLRAGRR